MFFAKSGNKAQDSSILEAGQMFTTDSTAIVLKNESKEVNIGDLPKFTFEMLANATNKFHEDNLLGRGGFGPVYKVTKLLEFIVLNSASTESQDHIMFDVCFGT